jgi:hypothetical protein
MTPSFGTRLGGYEAAILGSGFAPDAVTVRMGGRAVGSRVVSGTELRVDVPPSDSTGLVDVEVRRGDDLVRLERGFEYIPEMQRVDLAAVSPGVAILRDDSRSTGPFASNVAAGDFDGDGYSDCVVQFHHDGGTAFAIVRGRPGLEGLVTIGGLPANLGGSILECDAPDAAGAAITSLAVLDANGDGYDDLAIGTDEARAFLVFGRRTLPATLSLGLDLVEGGSARIVFSGLVANEDVSVYAELNVVAAGDQDADGLDDLAVGAPAGFVLGSVHIVHGRREWPAELDLAAPPERVTAITGADRPFLGRNVAGAGDFNGDGFDDLIAASYRRETAAPYGDIYLIPGGPEAGAAVDLSMLASRGLALKMSLDLALQLPGANDVHLAGGGDLNGDGFADVLIGVRFAGGDRGQVYGVWGGADVPAPADLGDIARARGTVITGELGGDRLGTVAMIGDFNADGVADALLGASGGGHGPVVDAPGKAYIVLGSEDFPPSLDLDRRGARGIRIDGVVGSGGFGYSVSNAGDVDGDGTADLLIGENGLYGADSVPDRMGNAYIVRSAYGGKGFRRGDANGDEQLDLSDGVAIIGYLFLGSQAPACDDAADSNDSGDVNISDAIGVLSYLFSAGLVPPAPGPEACGPDPTQDATGCEFYSCL